MAEVVEIGAWRIFFFTCSEYRKHMCASASLLVVDSNCDNLNSVYPPQTKGLHITSPQKLTYRLLIFCSKTATLYVTKQINSMLDKALFKYSNFIFFKFN